METVILLINDNRTWLMPLVCSGVLARLAWEAGGLFLEMAREGRGD